MPSTIGKDTARDSSVLFALQELRSLEDARREAVRQKAHCQERLRAERDARRRAHDEQQAAELARLRAREQDSRELRARLEQRVREHDEQRQIVEEELQRVGAQHAQALQCLSRRPPSSRWLRASALACGVAAIGFAFLYRNTVADESSGPPPAPAVLAASSDACPSEPAPTLATESAQLIAPTRAVAAAKPERADPSPAPGRRSARPKEKPGALRLPAAVDCEGKGPLCGLP